MTSFRVMHVVAGGDIGGAERLLTEVAARPEQTGAEHHVAVFTPNPALTAYLASCPAKIHDRGLTPESVWAYVSRSLGPADVAWLVDVLARERIDVVHTHTFGSHVLGTRAAQRARLPQVRTDHCATHYFDWSTSPFTRWAARRTDRLVAVSEYVRATVIGAVPAMASRATTIRNGVDTSYWAPRPASEHPFRAGIVGRLTAQKRVHLAIEAVALAGAELLVVGEGEERRRLEAVARRTDARVAFTGRLADPRPSVAECDVVISTCDNEALGLAVLEALSMERPVVAFAGGGIPEIVRDGETGWLVKDPTPRAFADAIVRAREDRERLRRMGAAARRYVVAECGIDRMCAAYGAVYRSLAS